LVIYATRGYFGSEPRTGPLGAGHVVALRREDGSEAWRFELPDSIGWSLSGGAVSGGAIWDDRLVVGGKSAWIYALQLTNGELLWKHPNGRSPPIGGYIARPVALGSVVVVPQANGVVDAWDSEGGQKLWSWEVPTGSLPVTVGDVLYTFNGMITVGDASGTVLWQAGGHTAYGGTSYFEGNVGPEGTIYTLGVEHFASGGGTFVYAIAPPVIPSGLE
jgi:outer membrane protein assembly factor BamB